VPERRIDWYGRRLRDIRQQRGLSQADLGRRVRLTAAQIHQLETNVCQATLATALALAEVLGVPITEFVSPHSAREATAAARGRDGGARRARTPKAPPRRQKPGQSRSRPKRKGK
jgi:transcriptional regulator with XRE-family HTH domain